MTLCGIVRLMRHPLYVLILVLVLRVDIIPAQAQETRLTVFAASSLTNAFEAIGEAFEMANPDVEIQFSFASSSTLAAQLGQGAPADLFASANERQMQVAVDSGRIAGSPFAFAYNRLALIVPANNPANIYTLLDLANPGVNLIIAAPETPIRTYTDRMLQNTAIHPAYGEDFRRLVMDNVVSEEPNVRLVSAKVVLGEADAGVVYHSDITPDIIGDVIVLPIPDLFNEQATYPIAVTEDTDDSELAHRFVEFVLSDTGQNILVEWNMLSVRRQTIPDVVELPTDGTVKVDGLILNPLLLTADILRSDYPLQTIVTTCLDEDKTTTATFTGVRLWDIVRAAQPHPSVNPAINPSSSHIVVTNLEEIQVAISWDELDLHLGNQPAMIGFLSEVNQVKSTTDNLWLVTPTNSDIHRCLPGIVNISLRDVPPQNLD